MKKIILFFFLAFFGSLHLSAQCSPDIEAPTPVLLSNLSVNIAVDEIEVWAQDFDLGSFDNCPGDLQFSFSTDTSNESQVFTCDDLGDNSLEVWVTDEAGNQSFATVTLNISGNPNPTMVCNNHTLVTLSSGGTATLLPEQILEGPEICIPAGWSIELDFIPPVGFSPTIEFDETDIGTHTVQVSLLDDDGNPGNTCWGTVEVLSCQTNAAPVAVCDVDITVNINAGETLTLTAEAFDDGSYDACTPQEDLIFEIENGVPPSSSNPGTTQLTFDEDDAGSNQIVLWVGDTDGNWNQCVVDLEVVVVDCDNDITAPTPYCLNGLQVELVDGTTEVEIWATDFDADSFDDCTTAANLEFALEATNTPSATPPSTASLMFEEGIHEVVMWVGDESGNWDYCQTTVVVSTCIPNVNLACNAMTFITLTPGGGFDLTPEVILEGDVCAGPGNYFAMQLDPPSTPLPVIPLTPADAGLHVISIGLYDSDDNLINECWGEIQVEANSVIWGIVYADTTADCTYGSEPVLAGQSVEGLGMVTGTVYIATTDAAGNFTLSTDIADTTVQVNLPLGYNYGGSCGTTYTVNFPAGNTSFEFLEIPVQLNGDCPLMTVDVGTNLLRRCFDNTYYVNFCNLSADAIEDVSVELTLDPFMDLVSSSIPGTETSTDLWSFDIGTLQPGECGDFSVVVNLSCDAALGATHCMQAHILPDTICPSSASFTGANIEVDGFCENDSIYMTITNTGTAAMAVPLDYIVVEDVIMLQGGDFELGPNESMPLAPIFADGSTYRLEAEQEPNHPYGGVAAIAIEGCGDAFTPGLVNLFPLSPPNPFISIECRENIGAYDPNDKQAFPRGVGEEHFIERNTDIEYMIRFQNTGTDTAFNVYILDTLSQYLDVETIRPGASSHAYEFEILDENVLRFSFPNIMLPDSNVNVALSQGFVKFRASQMLDLPLETVIENTAAIYFDFNEPVITNTVFHTIGENIIQVINSTAERPEGLGELNVYPNPSTGFVNFELPADAPERAVFQLHDQLGRLVKMEQFTGGNYRFEGEALLPDLYIYSVDLEGIGRYTGKIIMQ